METESSTTSERELAEKIIHLHDVRGLGFRKVAKRLSSEGFPLSKDKAHRLYWKYRPASSTVVEEAPTDKELESLKQRFKGAERRARLATEKREIRGRIADLMVEEAMNSFRIRKGLFSNERKLLRFLERIMPIVGPSLWIEFRNYCFVRGYNLAEAAAIAVGEPADYEAQLASSPNETQKLHLYFKKRLKECLDAWKQEEEETKEAQTNDAPKEFVTISIPLDDNQTY